MTYVEAIQDGCQIIKFVCFVRKLLFFNGYWLRGSDSDCKDDVDSIQDLHFDNEIKNT